LGLALVGFPHYTDALFLRLRPLLIPINRQLVFAYPVGGQLSPSPSIPLVTLKKLMVSAPRFVLLLSISFPSWGGVFYFLGMALSVS